MKSVMMKLRQASLLAGLLGVGLAQPVFGLGTASDTDIANRATVDYQVGGVSQTGIESSPLGNSTPGAGAGADTLFEVDNKVDLTVVEVDGAHTSVNPGQADAITTFRVFNVGNTPQNYALGVVNLAPGDIVHTLDDSGADMNNFRIFADHPTLGTQGTYDAGVDVDDFVDTLQPDDGTSTTFATVFVLANTSISDSNGDVANVRLTVNTYDAGTDVTVPANETVANSGVADDPTVVDVVIADAGLDGEELADDGYLFESADLTVLKTSSIVSDPFSSSNPKAIPGAVMEYTITITNNGTTDAASVRITDVIDANLTFLTGQYNGGAADVSVTIGASTTFCTVDAPGDQDGDGCGLTGATLEVGPGGGVTVVAPGGDNVATVRFQVTIN